jgi:glycolate oxidase FAD binding subunit
MQYLIDQFTDKIRAAAGERKPLRIRGAGTKDFYGHFTPLHLHAFGLSDVLDPTAYTGVVDYEPTELVVTARCGTRLTDLEAELSNHRQMLAFEPPHFGPGATIGGCVAAGLSGPRRATAGAVRDFVLGVRMLDGKGDDLSFGGRVMKNVAGYDVARLMTGSLGTLGLLLEISLKVLPLPAMELTLQIPLTEAEAIRRMNLWAGKPLPISATCFYGGQLMLRLSGAEPAVGAARAIIGGEEVSDAAGFWVWVREQQHPFFSMGKPLWRLSVKSTTPPLSLPGTQLIEWGGAVRWLAADDEGEAVQTAVRTAARSAGGNATLFRHAGSSLTVFHPLAPGMMKITRRLKEKFDPAGILNPGRMYPEL